MSQFLRQFQVVPFKGTEHVVEQFFQTCGRYSNFQKETFFLRWVAERDFAQWVEMCRSWQNRRFGYIYAEQFPNKLDTAQVERYRGLYSQGKLQPAFRFQNVIWNETFLQTLQEILLLFQRVRNCKEDSIINNFAVKLLYWSDYFFPKLFVETNKMTRFPKFVCSGAVGTSEYLFLYLLYRLGCDVLYLGKEQDVSVTSTELLALSQRVEQTQMIQKHKASQSERTTASQCQQRPTISRASLRRADRIETPSYNAPQIVPSRERAVFNEAVFQRSEQKTPSADTGVASTVSGQCQPMEFEQLARFASSVVMLEVFDENNECVKTGSGIIISHQGYILTNFHVVRGGAYYGILLEEEPDIFYTNELIKYHPELDLAILRSDKRRRPIPILDSSERLVRGQKVVAIGSPLGLFNTVSDGIVSGFRELRGRTMVQFTAPVSPGSSGGALLDLYGRLIGVITAGFDDGQNLNLAVDHCTIHQFAGNLVE